jgi:hypothetical protein
MCEDIGRMGGLCHAVGVDRVEEREEEDDDDDVSLIMGCRPVSL